MEWIGAVLTLADALARLPKSATNTLDHIAGKVADAYNNVSEAADLNAEFMLWLAERPSRSDKWIYVDDDGDEHFSWKQFKRDASRVMVGHAKVEHLRSRGMTEQDVENYGMNQIKALLPFVWREPVLVANGNPLEASGPSDPRTLDDMQVRVFDVRRAYDEVIQRGGSWDELLTLIYRDDVTQEGAARALGLDQSSVSRKHADAVRAIYEAINGVPDPLREFTGTRKVVSNQTAQAITHRYEEG